MLFPPHDWVFEMELRDEKELGECSEIQHLGRTWETPYLIQRQTDRHAQIDYEYEFVMITKPVNSTPERSVCFRSVEGRRRGMLSDGVEAETEKEGQRSHKWGGELRDSRNEGRESGVGDALSPLGKSSGAADIPTGVSYHP